MVVLEHIPRHDDAAKAELATVANNMMQNAREESEFAECILIGKHSGLEVDQVERRKRFTNDGSNWHSKHVKHGAYDGLHMYSQAGAEAFTTSLINILKQAGLGRREERQHDKDRRSDGGWVNQRPVRGFQANQQRRSLPAAEEFQIPTSNRFSVFGQRRTMSL